MQLKSQISDSDLIDVNSHICQSRKKYSNQWIMDYEAFIEQGKWVWFDLCESDWVDLIWWNSKVMCELTEISYLDIKAFLNQSFPHRNVSKEHVR